MPGLTVPCRYDSCVVRETKMFPFKKLTKKSLTFLQAAGGKQEFMGTKAGEAAGRWLGAAVLLAQHRNGKLPSP